MPGQDERHTVTGSDLEVRDRRQPLPAGRDRRAQFDGVGPGNRLKRPVDAPHPGHEGAIVEPDDEVHVHRHPAAHTLDHADDVGRLAAYRHAVDDTNHASGRRERRLENERVGDVSARDRNRLIGRRQLPSPVVTVTEQRGEARAGVEPREAQPIQRPVATDERRRWIDREHFLQLVGVIQPI